MNAASRYLLPNVCSYSISGVSDEAGRREAGNREAQAAELEADLAQACGTLNMAVAHQVELIAKVLESGSYAASGVRSAEQ